MSLMETNKLKKKMPEKKRPWAEDLRPKKLSEIRGNRKILDMLEESLKTGSYQAFMLNGTKGTGKTTISRIIASRVTGHGSDPKFTMVIKGKADGNVDMLRGDKIKNFVEYSFEPGTPKAIIVEELDNSTNDFKKGLRNYIEDWLDKGIVPIVNCNYREELDEAVLSRFIIIDFQPLTDEDMTEYLGDIKEKKKLTINDDAVPTLLKCCNGIPRIMVNSLQFISAGGTKVVTGEMVKAYFADNNDVIREIVNLAIKGKVDAALDKSATMMSGGKSGKEIIGDIFELTRKKQYSENPDVNNEIKRLLYKACATCDYQIQKGSVLIQLGALFTDYYIAWQVYKQMVKE